LYKTKAWREDNDRTVSYKPISYKATSSYNFHLYTFYKKELQERVLEL